MLRSPYEPDNPQTHSIAKILDISTQSSITQQCTYPITCSLTTGTSRLSYLNSEVALLSSVHIQSALALLQVYLHSEISIAIRVELRQSLATSLHTSHPAPILSTNPPLPPVLVSRLRRLLLSRAVGGMPGGSCPHPHPPHPQGSVNLSPPHKAQAAVSPSNLPALPFNLTDNTSRPQLFRRSNKKGKDALLCTARIVFPSSSYPLSRFYARPFASSLQ